MGAYHQFEDLHHLIKLMRVVTLRTVCQIVTDDPKTIRRASGVDWRRLRFNDQGLIVELLV